LAVFGSIWQHLAAFGNFWQLLTGSSWAALGSSWQLLAGGGDPPECMYVYLHEKTLMLFKLSTYIQKFYNIDKYTLESTGIF